MLKEGSLDEKCYQVLMSLGDVVVPISVGDKKEVTGNGCGLKNRAHESIDVTDFLHGNCMLEIKGGP